MIIKIVYNKKTGEIPEHKFNDRDGTAMLFNLRKDQDVDDFCVSMINANLIDFETFYVDIKRKNGEEKI